jgi:hypothetical protein
VTGPVEATPAGGRGGRGGRSRQAALSLPKPTDYFPVKEGDEVRQIRSVALRGMLLAVHNAGRVVSYTT